MATNLFDKPPVGFVRAKKGWLTVAQSPQRKTIDKLKSENTELKTRLEQLEAAVSELVSKKKK